MYVCVCICIYQTSGLHDVKVFSPWFLYSGVSRTENSHSASELLMFPDRCFFTVQGCRMCRLMSGSMYLDMCATKVSCLTFIFVLTILLQIHSQKSFFKDEGPYSSLGLSPDIHIFQMLPNLVLVSLTGEVP